MHIRYGVRPISARLPGSFPIVITSALASVLVGIPAVAQESGVRILEEVTVTAQRRTERSLDVPISITAIGSDALRDADVQQLSDIMKLTPGLRFDRVAGFFQPTIRGVGTAVAVAGGSSNVGVYTDGFYSPNPIAANAEMLNIESVQVLKGPQGTLFGRNSTGGELQLLGVIYYTSDFYFDSSESYQQDAYELVNARAAWVNSTGSYTVALFADNLTDEAYVNQVVPQFYGAYSTWGAPRTAGVSLGFNY